MKNRQLKHYKTLGLEPSADAKEIKTAYRKMAKKHHPDCAAGKHRSPEKFHEVQEAYETLCGGRGGDVNAVREGAAQQAPQSRRDPFEDFFEHAFSLFQPLFQAPPAHEPELEIILSAHEAAQGAEVTFDLPIEEPCSRCRQYGFRDFFCPVCDGTGRVLHMREVTLALPKNLFDGALIEIPVKGSRRSLAAIIRIS
jgi:DnaJ-class molecular chaperone